MIAIEMAVSVTAIIIGTVAIWKMVANYRNTMRMVDMYEQDTERLKRRP